MGSINSFSQAAGQEILLNKYLKAILKNQKLEIFSHFSGIS